MSRERSRSPRSSSDRDRNERRRSRNSSPDRDAMVLDGFWKPVRDDPQNFDAWTQLLQAVENMDDTKSTREAFDGFLEKFPYCFGYWRKYAEFERRHKHYDRSIEVYERGVNAIPLSIDLWLSYLAFYKDYVKDSDSKDKRIRYVYERALTSAGLEFRSDKLWEDYIAWEMKNENYPAVTGVYDRLLKTPTLQYSAHWDRFQEFVNSRDPHEIIAGAEYDKAFEDVSEQIREKGQEVFMIEDLNDIKKEPTSDVEDENDEAADKNDNISENGSGAGASDHSDDENSRSEKRKKDKKRDKTKKKSHKKRRSFDGGYRKKYNDEALTLFRMKILEKRRKIHLKTEKEVSERWGYEEQIKRPYFHVKPLERSQLKNWRQYLEFEIKEGSHDRVKVLFERCLIACALYEDMWIRYAKYMEKVDPSEARSVYERACRIHLARKPNPHLAWAMFEEKQGSFEDAKSILTKFDKAHPGLASIQWRRLSLEYRMTLSVSRKRDDSTPDFSDLCRRYELLIHDDQLAPRVASCFAIKFARFQSKIRKDNRLAEKVILDALERDKGNDGLHLFLVDLAYSTDPFSLEDTVKALDRALEDKHLTDSQKLEFSRRKYELLEEFGEDITEIQDHYEFHMKLSKSLGYSGSGGRKRAAETNDGDSKKARTDSTPVAATPATGPPMMSGAPPPHAGTPSGPNAAAGYYYYGGQQPTAAAAIPTPPFGVVPQGAAAYPYGTPPAQGGYYYPPNAY